MPCTTTPACRRSRRPIGSRRLPSPSRGGTAGASSWRSRGKIWPAERDRGWLDVRMRASLLVLALLVAAPAGARQTPVDELPRIVFSDPTRNLLKLAIPSAVGDGDVRQATEFEHRDFEVMGLFNLLDPASFPPTLQNEGLGFSSALWSQVGAQAVSKIRIGRDGSLEGRLYQLGRGESPVLTKTYRGSEARALVHQWVNDVIGQFTGVRGVFGSRIAFVQTGGSTEVASVGMDGGQVAVVTKMGSECILPA